jgi:hypothetical protein
MVEEKEKIQPSTYRPKGSPSIGSPGPSINRKSSATTTSSRTTTTSSLGVGTSEQVPEHEHDHDHDEVDHDHPHLPRPSNNDVLLGSESVAASTAGRHQHRIAGDEAPLVTGYSRSGSPSHEMVVKDAFRRDNSVIIQWEALVGNVLGFRVVYRLFGDESFKQGPPLAASEREFKIKNVPSQVSFFFLSSIHIDQLMLTNA